MAGNPEMFSLLSAERWKGSLSSSIYNLAWVLCAFLRVRPKRGLLFRSLALF
jgi:hypothetical protein